MFAHQNDNAYPSTSPFAKFMSPWMLIPVAAGIGWFGVPKLLEAAQRPVPSIASLIAPAPQPAPYGGLQPRPPVDDAGSRGSSGGPSTGLVTPPWTPQPTPPRVIPPVADNWPNGRDNTAGQELGSGRSMAEAALPRQVIDQRRNRIRRVYINHPNYVIRPHNIYRPNNFYPNNFFPRPRPFPFGFGGGRRFGFFR